MEHFEKLALYLAQHKPLLWLCYVDDIFVVWPHILEKLQILVSHLSSLRPSIKFTMKTESGSRIPFLGVLVIRNEMTLATKVYRKPIHTAAISTSSLTICNMAKTSLLDSSQRSFHHMSGMLRSA
jgi:hypothetical protein